jgi:hypothetical protein
LKITFSLLISSVLFANVALANELLKPDQIQNLLAGKKIVGQAPNGSMFDFQMNADFTAATSAAGGDTGKWRLSDDGYCATWTKIRKGAEACFKISKSGLNYFVIGPDGSQSRIVRID